MNSLPAILRPKQVSTKPGQLHATLERVDWYNTQRLFGPIGPIPPAEHEANYYREDPPQPAAAGLS